MGCQSSRCVPTVPQRRRCSVGIILPDFLYQPKFENTLSDNVIHFAGDKWLPKGVSAKDLREIQEAHDEGLFLEPREFCRQIEQDCVLRQP
jgi:hypothetical protein